MILEISASELTVTKVSGELEGIFVSGATVTTQNGYELFSVSGSDEYTATINGVDRYWIDEHRVVHVVLQETL